MGAKIYNSNLTKEIIDGAKLQINEGQIPSELAEKVIPVMEVNPNLLKKTNYIKNGTRTTTGTVSIATTETNKETYLTGAYLNLIKNAANDNATGSFNIRVVQDGITKNILGVPILTLTAQSEAISIVFANPIKVDKGTVITTDTLTVGAGAACVNCGVNGYQIDNITA